MDKTDNGVQSVSNAAVYKYLVTVVGFDSFWRKICICSALGTPKWSPTSTINLKVHIRSQRGTDLSQWEVDSGSPLMLSCAKSLQIFPERPAYHHTALINM